MHSAIFLWQSFSELLHGSTSLAQVTPAHLFAHVHVNLLTPSLHVAPFMQGDDKQSLTPPAQLTPL
jgi:hypothetical protein